MSSQVIERDEELTEEKTAVADPVVDEAGDRDRDTEVSPKAAVPDRKALSVKDGRFGLGTVIAGGVGVAMVATIGVLGYVVADKSSEMSSVTSAAASEKKAEKQALDYATGAANMNYKDLTSWNAGLTKNTSPELTSKLKEAASSMEQVIVPLQWTSTATPIAATVKSHDGDVYVVNAFVNVLTKNAQAPDGVSSTASYTVTMDSSRGWQITDVGGVDGALAPK